MSCNTGIYRSHTDKPIPSLFVMDGRLPQGPGPPGPEPEPPPNPKYQPIGAECASLPTITAVAAPAPRLGAPHHPMRLRKRFNGIVESLLKKCPTTPEGNLEPVDHTLGAPPAIASGPGVVPATTGVETTPKKKKKKKKKKIHPATSIGVVSASPSSSATIMSPSTPSSPPVNKIASPLKNRARSPPPFPARKPHP